MGTVIIGYTNMSMCAKGKSRSVHNIRIERLWYDVTQGIGSKWKSFFVQLEMEYELKVDNNNHIWLLHNLFLDGFNSELQEWGKAWNSHKLRVRGGKTNTTA